MHVWEICIMIPSIDLRNRKVLKNYHVWSTSVSLYMPVTYIAAPHLHPAATNKTSSSTARYNYHLKPITPNFDSSIALTILVLITAIFFMGFFSVYLRCFAKVSSTAEQVSSLRRNRNQQQRQRQISSTSGEESTTSHQHHGLDPSTVGSLPLVSAGGKAKQQPVEECVVCLSEFEDTEIVKMIPYCEHVFHPQCIDMWFLSHSTCPLCRSTKLFPSPPYRNSNSVLPAVNDKCGGDVANSLSLSGRELGHDDDDQVGVCHESLDKKPRVLMEGDKSDDVGDTDQEEVVDQRDEVLKCRRPMKLNMRRTRSCSSLSSSSAHQVLLQRSLSSN